ncbi:hypothetical protein [Brevundimonas vesicularis]|uniref:hypothetical protein n=1 Tax=Brevundimonas vesicularis TaxID=41276 RepID=UPI0038D43BD3
MPVIAAPPIIKKHPPLEFTERTPFEDNHRDDFSCRAKQGLTRGVVLTDRRLPPIEIIDFDRLHPTGMEVRYGPKLTQPAQEINDDSSPDSHLNCLTPAKSDGAWEFGKSYPLSNAGFFQRLRSRQQDGEGAFASSPLKSFDFLATAA